jgi:hypothetical protein
MLHTDTYQRLQFDLNHVPGSESDAARANAHNSLISLADTKPNTEFFPAGVALVIALDGWNRMAHAHKTLSWNEDGSPIGKDSYAAPYFLDMGKALIGMLAMDSRSALQSGKVDTFILETLHTNGFTEDETN